MLAEDRGRAAAEWRRHWPLVLAAALGFSFVSFLTPSVGVFMEPLHGAFGWSRTQLSAGIAISGVLSVIASPFVGGLVDRLGTRRIALPGIVLTSLAIAGFATANGSAVQWILLWAFWGIGALLIQAMVWSVAVASVFQAGRGTALGFTFTGAALGQIIAPPLANALIAAEGWRAAFVIMGVGWGLIALVANLLFLFDARDTRRRAASHGAAPETVATLAGLTIREAWRSSALWRIGIASFLILTITIAVSVHQFPILTAAGVDRTSAAWLVSLFGVAGIVGKLTTGWLVDRIHGRWVGGITLASTAVAYPLLFDSIRTVPLIVVAILISGYAAGTKIQLCGYLSTRYGGLRHYGAIFGVMTSAIAIASVVGPLSAGRIFDATGSYNILLLGGTIVSLVSGALLFSLGRYPEWPQVRADV